MRRCGDRVAYVADLASAWARLRRKPACERNVACVLSDYPAKGGRVGYAVGLDTPRSVLAIGETLREAGYDVGALPSEAGLIGHLSSGRPEGPFSRSTDYERAFAQLPDEFIALGSRRMGRKRRRPGGARRRLSFPFIAPASSSSPCSPIAAIARRARANITTPIWRRATPMSPSISGCANVARIDAMIHCGTHGTLEWLPGKSVALSASCAPEVVLGPVPVVYPFIVNNPGEAAQAKRRIGAVTIGHLTPPLIAAGSHGAAAELEGLFDEYAQAQALDPRRARAIAELILETRAGETGLSEECAASGLDPEAALVRLDAWLCDLKDMRIGDGLHVFGRQPDAKSRAENLDILLERSGADAASIGDRLDACAGAEMSGLLAALDGRFVAPGPAGAPARGRLDVLPTGRNLFSVDPRAVPTRTAWEIGRRTAEEVVARYAQDHGEWPRRIVLDLWGSATMRTGGDDIAQAFALLGVRPPGTTPRTA